MKQRKESRNHNCKMKKPNKFLTGVAIGAAVLSFGIMGCAPKRKVAEKPRVVLKILPLPVQIKEGYGTKDEKYQVYPENGREEKGIGGREIEMPITYRLYEDSIYFNMRVTLSQLTPENKAKTVEELNQIVREAVEAYMGEGGVDLWGEVKVDLTVTIDKYIIAVSEIDKDVKEYLQGSSEE